MSKDTHLQALKDTIARLSRHQQRVMMEAHNNPKMRHPRLRGGVGTNTVRALIKRGMCDDTNRLTHLGRQVTGHLQEHGIPVDINSDCQKLLEWFRRQAEADVEAYQGTCGRQGTMGSRISDSAAKAMGWSDRKTGKLMQRLKDAKLLRGFSYFGHMKLTDEQKARCDVKDEAARRIKSRMLSVLKEMGIEHAPAAPDKITLSYRELESLVLRIEDSMADKLRERGGERR